MSTMPQPQHIHSFFSKECHPLRLLENKFIFCLSPLQMPHCGRNSEENEYHNISSNYGE